jgi:hypothetical protein
VHFTDAFEDGKMSFDYKLRLGVVNRTNAREILALLGIPVQTIQAGPSGKSPD